MTKNCFYITKDCIGVLKDFDEKTVDISILPEDGHRFRLYDDDNVLYFEGVFYGDCDSEAGFVPLDWAMNDSGCTSIQYLRENKWETLQEKINGKVII